MRQEPTLLKRLARLGLLTGMLGGLPACAHTVSWQEEVKFNDGRVIVVTQKKRCASAYTGSEVAPCIAREAWLTIPLPEFSRADIVWHERLKPRVLNIHDGRLYVVGFPPTRAEADVYGKPRPPYIGFVFEQGQWRRIPFAEIPEAIYDTNMLIEGLPPPGISYLSIEKKESREINGKPTYLKSVKRIDPNLPNW